MAPPQSTEAQTFGVSVATEIRAEMARQKKTQEQLAEALGVNPVTASRRINGTAPFNIEEIFTVAQWLGVRPEDFIPSTSLAVAQ